MFAELDLLRRYLDNSITIFLMGLVILFSSFSGVLLPGMDSIGVVIGGFLSIFLPYVMIWKERVGINCFILLFRVFLAFGVSAMAIIFMRPEALIRMMNENIWIPSAYFLYLAEMFLFLTVGIGVLIIILGLKKMLSQD